MKRCVECGGREFADIEAEDKIKIGNYAVTVTGLPATKCIRCGERYYHGDVVERSELTAGLALAERGVSTGELVRHFRKSLGMRAVDLAELLGTTPETVSRWENERVDFDRTVTLTLAAIASDRLTGRTTTEDRLRALQGPPPSPSRPLRINLKKAA